MNFIPVKIFEGYFTINLTSCLYKKIIFSWKSISKISQIHKIFVHVRMYTPNTVKSQVPRDNNNVRTNETQVKITYDLMWKISSFKVKTIMTCSTGFFKQSSLRCKEQSDLLQTLVT